MSIRRDKVGEGGSKISIKSVTPFLNGPFPESVMKAVLLSATFSLNEIAKFT